MKAIRRLCLPVSALIGLSGCALKSSSFPNQPLPADWKHAAGFPVSAPSRDLSRWWNRFQDPVLNRLISTALAESPDVASASARIRESRARRNTTAANLFPTIDAAAGSNSSTSRRDGFSRTEDTSYSLGLDASWEVDLFGKIRSNIEAASAELGATQENYNSVQAALASEIAIAYTSLRSTEARLQIVRNSIESRKSTYDLADFRRQAGLADDLESNQALTSLEQARASIPSLEQTASQTRNLLAVLAGRPPGSLDGMLATGKKTIPNPSRNLAVGIPADTLRQRPDVRVAGFQWLSAAASLRAADAERYPSLRLSGSLGLNALSSTKIFDPDTFSAGVISGITSPIFDAGRIRSNIEAQTAVQEQALQTYRSVVLNALSEVEDSLIACRRTAERLETLERATVTARATDLLARQSYEAGQSDFLTVLDSQRTLLSLEETLVSVRADRTIAYIQLYKALGGGWSAQ